MNTLDQTRIDLFNIKNLFIRNLEYFSQTSNLEKLRNVITTYVWENLEEGYMQVMLHRHVIWQIAFQG